MLKYNVVISVSEAHHGRNVQCIVLVYPCNKIMPSSCTVGLSPFVAVCLAMEAMEYNGHDKDRCRSHVVQSGANFLPRVILCTIIAYIKELLRKWS